MSNRKPQDVIRQIYAAFGRGDIPAIVAALAPDVTWTVHANGNIPYGGQHLGRAAVERWFDTIARTMTITQFDVDRFVAEGETVVCLGRFACAVKDTGKPYATPFVHVWQVQDGSVATFEDFFDSAVASTAYAA
jgi:ketosteroid isomerase-like protein